MKRIVALLLAALLAATCLEGVAATVTTKEKTNLYSEASADSKPITGLKAGATLEVEGTTKNYFKVVTSGGNEGYVLKSKVWVDDEGEYQTARDMTGVKPSGKKTEEYTKDNVPWFGEGGQILGFKLGMSISEARKLAENIELEKTYDGISGNNSRAHELDFYVGSPTWKVRCNFWDGKLIKVGLVNWSELQPEVVLDMFFNFVDIITQVEGKADESGGNLEEGLFEDEKGYEKLVEGVSKNKYYMFSFWKRSYWIMCQIGNELADFSIFAVTVTAPGFEGVPAA